MKKYLIILIAGAVFFSACMSTDTTDKPDPSTTESLPEIAWTRIDADFFESSDELALLTLDELPFSAKIPEGWTWTENPEEYILWIDEGSTGSITISKNPLSNPDDFSANEEAKFYLGFGVSTYCLDENCLIHSKKLDDVYPAIVTNRGFNEKELGEVELIFQNFETD
jgi:hypothetical protein